MSSKTEIRQAFLDTAALFESRPRLYDFNRVMVPAPIRKSAPRKCGSPGCVMGWVAAFLGLAKDRSIGFVEPMIGISNGEFYQRMDEISDTWMESAQACAAAIRLYVDQYYPEGQ